MCMECHANYGSPRIDNANCKLTAAAWARDCLMTPKDFEGHLISEQHLQAVLTKAVREHNIAIENLTEQQTVEAFRQAIACGDFTRNVVATTGAQCVTYIPYAREQELQHRVHELEAQLKAARDGTAMTEQRWDAVFNHDAALTPKEIADGWHFCNSWDGLLVGPGMGELQFCKCNPTPKP